jgi:hypothetical protein
MATDPSDIGRLGWQRPTHSRQSAAVECPNALKRPDYALLLLGQRSAQLSRDFYLFTQRLTNLGQVHIPSTRFAD